MVNKNSIPDYHLVGILARMNNNAWLYATIYIYNLYTGSSYNIRFAKSSPSDKAHFSPLLNCYTNELMIHVCIIANDSLVCFSWGFLGLSDMLKCSGGLQMAVVWLDKYPSGWKSPHNWPVNLAIELATICDI